MLRDRYLQQMGITRWVSRDNHSYLDSPSRWEIIEKKVVNCTQCPLHRTRTQTVFYRGNPKARFMIVGEAPGFYEDQQGKPFVGKAGALLNKMLLSIGLHEDDVCIVNVLKCRPPNNRDPAPDEINACQSFLSQQIEVVNPLLILGLGRFAGQVLSNSSASLTQLRQQDFFYQGIPVLISYHPAYLLRNPVDKKKAYQDLNRFSAKRSLFSSFDNVKFSTLTMSEAPF